RAPRPGPPGTGLRRRPGALRSRARRHASHRDGVRPAARAAPPPPACRGDRKRPRQRHAGGCRRRADRPPPRPRAARGRLARPDATAAVHTHAPVATAFGITTQRFPPINTDAVFLADTQIVPWSMPGSKELADAVGEALKASRGAILQCHGLMTVGKTMRDA